MRSAKAPKLGGALSVRPCRVLMAGRLGPPPCTGTTYPWTQQSQGSVQSLMMAFAKYKTTPALVSPSSFPTARLETTQTPSGRTDMLSDVSHTHTA